MRKLFISIVLLALPILMLNAQDTITTSKQEKIMTSKKGIPILPQAGDWAFGIDARPFTQIFNSNSNIGFNFMNDNTLIGKKFIKNNLAHRLKVRFAFYSQSNDEYVIEDGQLVPISNITVTDTRVINRTMITVGYGLEKRSGYGRLQALYGGEVLFGFDQQNTSYNYGNGFSMSNPSPTSYNFDGNVLESGKRVVFSEPAYDLMAALRAFIGVEYFVAPKLAIGGEFGWGVAYSVQNEGKTKIESWDAGAVAIQEDVYKTGGSKYIGFDNDNFGGLIYLIFHFK